MSSKHRPPQFWLTKENTSFRRHHLLLIPFKMLNYYWPAGKKKEGNAAKYITRTKVVHYLQVSLATFRKCALLRGYFSEIRRRRWKIIDLYVVFAIITALIQIFNINWFQKQNGNDEGTYLIFEGMRMHCLSLTASKMLISPKCLPLNDDFWDTPGLGDDDDDINDDDVDGGDDDEDVGNKF